MKYKVIGRYPFKGSARMIPESMELDVSVFDDTVVLRIDDKDNLDVWIEVVIDKCDLKAMLNG